MGPIGQGVLYSRNVDRQVFIAWNSTIYYQITSIPTSTIESTLDHDPSRPQSSKNQELSNDGMMTSTSRS